MRYYFLIQSFFNVFIITLLLIVVAIFIGKFVFQPLVLVTEWLCKAIYIVLNVVKNILTLLFLMTFADSRLFTLDRLSTFSTLYSRSTLDFYSRLPTFTLDSRLLLSTLDLYSRLSTFRYTRFCYRFIFVYGFLILLSNQVRSFELNVRSSLLNSQFNLIKR